MLPLVLPAIGDADAESGKANDLALLGEALKMRNLPPEVGLPKEKEPCGRQGFTINLPAPCRVTKTVGLVSAVDRAHERDFLHTRWNGLERERGKLQARRGYGRDS